ncbi:MAG: hypothetical protein K0V04_31665 [Deltaproteobacteria bacterium]|nr:hypothetical protein [Deltaproteobacteria bacterium]
MLFLENRLFQNSYPLVLGGVVGILFLFSGYSGTFGLGKAEVSTLFAAAIGAGGTMAGFVLTAKAIIIGLGDNSYIKAYRDSGGLDGLLQYMFSAIISSLTLVVLSLAFLIFPSAVAHSTPPSTNLWLFALWAGSFVVVVAHVFRVASTMKTVILSVNAGKSR